MSVVSGAGPRATSNTTSLFASGVASASGLAVAAHRRNQWCYDSNPVVPVACFYARVQNVLEGIAGVSTH